MCSMHLPEYTGELSLRNLREHTGAELLHTPVVVPDLSLVHVLIASPTRSNPSMHSCVATVPKPYGSAVSGP